MNIRSVSRFAALCLPLLALRADAELAVKNDFDGDGLSDIAIYSGETTLWYLLPSASPYTPIQFGFRDGSPLTGDFDNDGQIDIATVDRFSAVWGILKSTEGLTTFQFGFAGAQPVTGDFDGDGETDVGCYYPGNGGWYFVMSSNGFFTTTFGADVSWGVTGDFDGDGLCDFGYTMETQQLAHLMLSTVGATSVPFGTGNARPIVGDFDNDGRDDLGAYDYVNFSVTLYRSTLGATTIAPFGADGCEVVSGDYDGDGKDDVGFYVTDTGDWTILLSAGGTKSVQFGFAGTFPLGSTTYAASSFPQHEVPLSAWLPGSKFIATDPGVDFNVRLIFGEGGSCTVGRKRSTDPTWIDVPGQYSIRKDKIIVKSGSTSADKITVLLYGNTYQARFMSGYYRYQNNIRRATWLQEDPYYY